MEGAAAASTSSEGKGISMAKRKLDQQAIKVVSAAMC
jgi:hypothetical protein